MTNKDLMGFVGHSNRMKADHTITRTHSSHPITHQVALRPLGSSPLFVSPSAAGSTVAAAAEPVETAVAAWLAAEVV